MAGSPDVVDTARAALLAVAMQVGAGATLSGVSLVRRRCGGADSTRSYRRRAVARALMSACEDGPRARRVQDPLMVRLSDQDVIAFDSTLGYVEGEVVVLGRFLDQQVPMD